MRKIALASLITLLCSCSMHTPVQVTDNVVGKKVGEVCATYIFYNLNIGGNNFAHMAAKQGKIKKISTMNQYISGLFPFYYKSCTVVSGN